MADTYTNPPRSKGRMIETEAWVLYRQDGNSPLGLVRESFTFPEIEPDEVLAEPLYGCWEGNMDHAVARNPIDVCEYRNESRIVLGNSGVVRILKIGKAVTSLREGQICILFSSGTIDRRGYMKLAFAYDAWGTIGVLARRHKLREWQLLPIPSNTQFSLQQWAAFSVRYTTAWANWHSALGCWKSLSCAEPSQEFSVWGWGGGVALAEVLLALHDGFRCALIASDPKRLQLIRSLGITAVDRRDFPDLYYDQDRCRHDGAYRRRYLNSTRNFSSCVHELAGGEGVSIFIDNIGAPVFQATLNALACPGVICTAGWKRGMKMIYDRAPECFQWHAHVHTHHARREQVLQAIAFAEENGWMPIINEPVCRWEDIGKLAAEYSEGKVTSYFPVFEVCGG